MQFGRCLSPYSHGCRRIILMGTVNIKGENGQVAKVTSDGPANEFGVFKKVIVAPGDSPDAPSKVIKITWNFDEPEASTRSAVSDATKSSKSTKKE